jgi:hypothetical protein
LDYARDDDNRQHNRSIKNEEKRVEELLNGEILPQNESPSVVVVWSISCLTNNFTLESLGFWAVSIFRNSEFCSFRITDVGKGTETE